MGSFWDLCWPPTHGSWGSQSSTLKEKPTLKVTVSSGSEIVFMPDLVNQEYRNAFLTLQKLKLEVREDLVVSDTVTEGYVISITRLAVSWNSCTTEVDHPRTMV